MNIEERIEEQNIHELYRNPYGLWNVVTDSYQGLEVLGPYYGNFYDIAFYLREQGLVKDYLIFKRVNINRITVPKDCSGEVTIAMDDESDWRKEPSENMCHFWEHNISESEGVSFTPIKYQGGCIIKREKKVTSREEAIEKAKKALSPEEFALLFPNN